MDSGTVDADRKSAATTRLGRGGLHWTNTILLLQGGIVRPLCGLPCPSACPNHAGLERLACNRLGWRCDIIAGAQLQARTVPNQSLRDL